MRLGLFQHAGLVLTLLAGSVAQAQDNATSGAAVRQGTRQQPTVATTNFTAALRCVDQQLVDFNVRNLSLLIEDLDDSTKKVNAGTKDMLISAMSEASKRSRALRLVAFGNDSRNVVTFMERAQRNSSYQKVPDYGVRGSVSQFDDNLEKTTKDAGFSLGSFLNLGSARSTGTKVLGVDLTIIRTDDFSVLPGVTAKNAVILVASGAGTDASASIQKFGFNYQTTTAQNEGTSIGLRNLIEFSSVELIGKLARIPYWRCLGASDDDPAVRSEMVDWYEGMLASERRSELFTYFQGQLYGLGLYNGPSDGVPTPQLSQAVREYRQHLGLSATPELSQEFFEKHLLTPRGPLRDRIDAALAARPAAAPATPPPAPVADPKPAAAASAPGDALPSLVEVSFVPDRPAAVPGRAVELAVRVSSPVFLSCFMKDDSGAILRLLPNSGARSVRAAPGQDLPLRGKTDSGQWNLTFNERGVPETVACFATLDDIGRKLPRLMAGRDFRPLAELQSFDQVPEAVQRSGSSVVGEARITLGGQ